MIVLILGVILGLAMAGAAGWLLGSWLVLALSALPLAAVGALSGMMYLLYRSQRRVVENPWVVGNQVDE